MKRITFLIFCLAKTAIMAYSQVQNPGPETLGTKDIFQISAFCVAIVGGLVGVYKGVVELKLSRIQRETELRWKKANLAREILSKFQEGLIKDSLRMLDWSGRKFKLPNGEEAAITFEIVEAALRVTNLHFSGTEGYIRDCFDQLLDELEHIEHYIEIGLLEEEDVMILSYYFPELSRQYMVDYMRKYEYHKVIRFLGRLS